MPGFFQDIFSGNFAKAFNSPDDLFKDIGGKNTIPELLGGAALAAPFLLPEIGAGLGAAGTALGLGGDVTADASLGAAAADAPLDLTAAAGAGADAALPANATLDALSTGASGYSLPGTAADLVNSDFATLGSGVDASGGAIAGAGAPLNLAATAGNAAASGAAGSGGVFSSLGSTLSSAAGGLKTVAPLLGVGGLAANLYTGYEQKQALNQLNSQEQQNAQTAANISSADQSAAAPLLNSGEMLTSYLSTGTLPQAFQSQVTQQVQATKAQIIQGYASRGMSTDPNQNSGLAQDLANVDSQSETLKASLESTLATAGNQMVTTANQLLSSGLSATQLSSELPIQVAQLNSSLNAQMSAAVSNFAAALNGSNTKTNVTAPQNIVGTGGTLQNLNA